MALLLAVACGGPGLPEPVGVGGDFTLVDQCGDAWSLADHRGRPAVLFFGFTTCPDICPNTLAEIRTVRDRLGDDADALQVLFVSVDPDRDTPERLATYLEATAPGAVGLTGTAEDLAVVARKYGASFDRVPQGDDGGYTVDHSAWTYVLDRDGVVRFLLRYEEGPDELEKALRAVLRGA
jgi:protein SCO1/2